MESALPQSGALALQHRSQTGYSIASESMSCLCLRVLTSAGEGTVRGRGRTCAQFLTHRTHPEPRHPESVPIRCSTASIYHMIAVPACWGTHEHAATSCQPLISTSSSLLRTVPPTSHPRLTTLRIPWLCNQLCTVIGYTPQPKAYATGRHADAFTQPRATFRSPPSWPLLTYLPRGPCCLWCAAPQASSTFPSPFLPPYLSPTFPAPPAVPAVPGARLPPRGHRPAAGLRTAGGGGHVGGVPRGRAGGAGRQGRCTAGVRQVYDALRAARAAVGTCQLDMLAIAAVACGDESKGSLTVKAGWIRGGEKVVAVCVFAALMSNQLPPSELHHLNKWHRGGNAAFGRQLALLLQRLTLVVSSWPSSLGPHHTVLPDSRHRTSSNLVIVRKASLEHPTHAHAHPVPFAPWTAYILANPCHAGPGAVRCAQDCRTVRRAAAGGVLPCGGTVPGGHGGTPVRHRTGAVQRAGACAARYGEAHSHGSTHPKAGRRWALGYSVKWEQRK